jgi:hypothetical protein
MKVKIQLFIILLIFGSNVHAQHLSYAKKVIDSLSSPAFFGRGYAYSGDFKAAEYLHNECLKYASETFVQEFPISVNSLVGDNCLHIENDTLTAGEDYLCAATSPGVKGRFALRVFNKVLTDDSVAYAEFVRQNHSEHVIVLDTAGFEPESRDEIYQLFSQLNILQAKGIIALHPKLPPFVPGRYQAKHFLFHLKKERFNSDADSVELCIEADYQPAYKTRNLTAKLEGRSDSAIVFTAHYDHVGTMGKDVYFPGANDNASGTAAVLSLLRYFSDKENSHDLYFLFFSAEEAGILGSKYYTENPIFPLSEIKFLINLDMVGSGSQGIQVVNGSVHQKQFDLLKELNTQGEFLTKIKIRGAAANSDHYPFHAKGVKSFFIYTLGNYTEYHNIYDTAEALPLKAFDDLLELLIRFTQKL